MILCGIGGDDTYRLLPYLFENDALKKAVKNKGLERSFKQGIPQEVYDRLEKEMGEVEKR